MGTCADLRSTFFVPPSSGPLSHNALVCSSFQLEDRARHSSVLGLTDTQSQLPSKACSAWLACSFLSASRPGPGCLYSVCYSRQLPPAEKLGKRTVAICLPLAGIRGLCCLLCRYLKTVVTERLGMLWLFIAGQRFPLEFMNTDT